jgi:hypothetical protein
LPHMRGIQSVLIPNLRRIPSSASASMQHTIGLHSLQRVDADVWSSKCRQ